MQSRSDGDVLFFHGRRSRRPLFLFLVRHHGTILATAISCILLLTTWSRAPYWTTFGVAGYWLVRLGRMAIVRRESLRQSYRSAPIQFGIATALVAAVSVFLTPFYHSSGFLTPTSEDTLWLLYVLPVMVSAQIGALRIVLGFSLFSGLALHFSTHPLVAVLQGSAVHDTTVKTIWIFLFSFIVLTLIRIVGDRSANLRILHALFADKAALRANPNVARVLHSVAVAASREFEYEHVAIYSLGPDEILALVATNSHDVTPSAEMRILNGENIPSHVARTGKAYTANDIVDDELFDQIRLFPIAASEMAVPIKRDGKVVGIIDLRDSRRDRFLDQDREACEVLATYISSVLDNAALLSSRQHIGSITSSITQRFFSREQLGHVLRDIVRAAHDELQADVVMLYEHEPLTGAVRFGARSGDLLYPEVVDTTINRRPSLVEKMLTGGQEADFDQSVTDLNPRSFASREQIRSRAVIALSFDQKTLGLMFLNYRHLHAFDGDEREACLMFGRLAALAIHREQARERELTRQRREFVLSLHDAIGTKVKGVSYIVESLMKQPELAAAALPLRLVAHGLQRIEVAVREIAKIHDNIADTPATQLAALADECTRVYGTPVILTRFDVGFEFTPEVFSQVRSIVQEAVTNAAKSGASEIRIELIEVDTSCRVLVADDGCGFDPATVKRGRGINIMAERARWIDGQLVIRSEPSQGTRVELALPLDAATSTASREQARTSR